MFPPRSRHVPGHQGGPAALATACLRVARCIKGHVPRHSRSRGPRSRHGTSTFPARSRPQGSRSQHVPLPGPHERDASYQRRMPPAACLRHAIKGHVPGRSRSRGPRSRHVPITFPSQGVTFPAPSQHVPGQRGGPAALATACLRVARCIKGHVPGRSRSRGPRSRHGTSTFPACSHHGPLPGPHERDTSYQRRMSPAACLRHAIKGHVPGSSRHGEPRSHHVPVPRGHVPSTFPPRSRHVPATAQHPRAPHSRSEARHLAADRQVA